MYGRPRKKAVDVAVQYHEAVANMNDMRKLGRIGGKMLGLYIAFGAVSGILGLILAFMTNL